MAKKLSRHICSQLTCRHSMLTACTPSKLTPQLKARSHLKAPTHIIHILFTTHKLTESIQSSMLTAHIPRRAHIAAQGSPCSSQGSPCSSHLNEQLKVHIVATTHTLFKTKESSPHLSPSLMSHSPA
jgi:hypothetical protein